jgi:hypothetical protein
MNCTRLAQFVAQSLRPLLLSLEDPTVNLLYLLLSFPLTFTHKANVCSSSSSSLDTAQTPTTLISTANDDDDDHHHKEKGKEMAACARPGVRRLFRYHVTLVDADNRIGICWSVAQMSSLKKLSSTFMVEIALLGVLMGTSMAPL